MVSGSVVAEVDVDSEVELEVEDRLLSFEVLPQDVSRVSTNGSMKSIFFIVILYSPLWIGKG